MAVTIAAFAIAAVVTLTATPLVRRLALRLDVVDHPGPLKIHRRPVAYLGGLAVYAGLVAGTIGGGRSLALLTPVGLALLLGLVDDRFDLSPRSRLAAEAGIGVVAAGVVRVPGTGGGGWLLTAVAVLVLVNAVNLLDGMDGLASGVALVSAAGFAAILGGAPQMMALALAGGAAAFLVFNRPPASIYLGDSGAYAIGTALALLLVSSWADAGSAGRGLGGLALVAVPVVDTAVAVIRRARAGRPLFAGDRGHIYDQLVDRGLGRGAVTLLCIGAQGALTGAAILVALSTTVLSAVMLAALCGGLALALVAGGFLSPEYARSDP